MIKKLLVSFLGSGYLPAVPGTWGSLAAAVIYLLLANSRLGKSHPTLWIVTAGLTVLATVIGIALGKWATRHYHSEDPKPFVLDEVAGMWLSLLVIPFDNRGALFLMVAVQFILFRLFDIIKPTPARQAEDLPFGWGIVIDDLVAGVYANICGQIIFCLILPRLAHG
ncbi:MAG: phosphatidylglycerophosphatase A [Phycisphaerae bacterium]